jgi:hypothetical protein
MSKSKNPTSPKGDVETPKTQIETNLRDSVLDVLRDVALDRDAPAAARVQAARTLAEMAGLIGRVQSAPMDDGTLAESEMTPEAIDREIKRLAQARKAKDVN